MASSTSFRSDPVEVTEIVDTLRDTPPFDHADRDEVRRVSRHIEITYAPKDTVVLEIGTDPAAVILIRSGAVDLTNEQGALVARLGEGDFFGYPAVLTGDAARRRVQTREDSLLYHIPADVFDWIRGRCPAVDRFFAQAHSARIRDALREEQQNRPLSTSLRSLVSRAPVTAAPDVSIRRAAQTMRDHGVSCLLLCEDDALVGLVTDRDLRIRVLADGTAADAPVRTIMTAAPTTAAAHQYAFEALLTMSRHNIHHLPVMDDDLLIGVVTATDLLRLQADNPVYVIGELWKQDTVDGLASLRDRATRMLVDLVESGARPNDVARVTTAFTDALTQRLLQLAEDKIGAPPVPYAWMALGSQARHEQTAHSDQDHALLLDDDTTAAHDAYFSDLAAFVSDGLNACGYPYCPGGVMATTDRWRQSLSDWKTTFAQWIEEPEPDALMHASIFFDLRHVHGPPTLTDTLQQFILDRTPDRSLFLACLAADALEHRPPLGFFRQFVLSTHGEHEDTLDLKHDGLVPIVDLARLHALAHGVPAVNTRRRLSQLADRGHLNGGDAADLRDAFSFIAKIRLRHQVDQLAQNEAPDNYVAPGTLSAFDRRHLKDAFRIVKTAQSAIEQRYQTSLIS
jgi:CBS domain-containing protein